MGTVDNMHLNRRCDNAKRRPSTARYLYATARTTSICIASLLGG
jgi:hypothetical protein